MKRFEELRIFEEDQVEGNSVVMRAGLWGRNSTPEQSPGGLDQWERVCECPKPMYNFKIGPQHIEPFTQGNACSVFNSMEIAETVQSIVAVCRQRGRWSEERSNPPRAFILSDIPEERRPPLDALIQNGFVVKNADDTYAVTIGLVLLLISEFLRHDAIPERYLPADLIEEAAV